MENYECVIWPRVPHDFNGHPGQGRPNIQIRITMSWELLTP